MELQIEPKYEFYSIRRRPHERNEIVVAVNKNNGGYVYYSLSTGNLPAATTNELLKNLIIQKEIRIIRIKKIEDYLDFDCEVHGVDINNLENNIIYQRLCRKLESVIKSDENADDKTDADKQKI